MVITLQLHPFHISHLFLNAKWNLTHLNFVFLTLIPYKIGKTLCETWNRNEACPTTLPMKSGHRSKLKVVLALYAKVKTDRGKYWPIMTINCEYRCLYVTNVTRDCHGRTLFHTWNSLAKSMDWRVRLNAVWNMFKWSRFNVKTVLENLRYNLLRQLSLT